MEPRKIYINDTESNSKIEINTNATTLGELKQAVREAGINVNNKDFFEGLTKSTLNSDDSLLPTNINYKGTVTNSLVFMLTKTNKAIASGAMSRSELYAEIKKQNLAEAIKMQFGRNYTQVSSSDLADFVSKAQKKSEPKKVVTSEKKETSFIQEDYKRKYTKIVRALAYLMVESGEEVAEDLDAAVMEIATKKPKDLDLTAEEIAEMF